MIVLLHNAMVARGWRSRSGTVGGKSPGCFFAFLPKRSLQKPDHHRKDVIQL